MKIPEGPYDINPKWLTDKLTQRGIIRDVEVSSIEVEPLSGIGLTAEISRLCLAYRGSGDAIPKSVIAKFSVASERRWSMREFRLYEREVRFYEEFSERVEIRTPKSYYSFFDPETADHILLIEDISHARPGDRFAGCSTDDADLAVREIAGFHAQWWDSSELERKSWLVVPHLRQTYHEIYQQSWGAFIEKAAEVMSPAMLEIGEALCEKYLMVTRRLFDPPVTILHRDYHLDNFFFDLENEPGTFAVIDWQWVTKGRGAYDIAYFLATNLEPIAGRKAEARLLRTYYQTLKRGGIQNYEFREFFDDYRRGVLATFVQYATITGIGLFDDKLEQVLSTLMRRIITTVLELNCGELL